MPTTNVNAYSYPIGPIGSGKDEDGAIHQSSPAWVLTFVRWNVQDPLRTPVTATSDPEGIRNTIIVENDCISVTTTSNKGSLTPAMSAVLLQTDVNYETAIHPGDFVFVNMLNWESDARAVAQKVRDGKPINEFGDGFKGFYKVQSVRKTVVVIDQEKGTKAVQFRIDGFAFTEFNNTIYFNPNLVNQKSLDNQALYISDIAAQWKNFATRAGKPYIQELIALLIQSLVGSGVNPKAQSIGGLVISPNVKFIVPSFVGKLLGVVTDDKPKSQAAAQVIAAKDTYNYLFGIQRYAAGSSSSDTVLPAVGFSPSNLEGTQHYPGFYYTDTFCQGNSLLKAEYWNQVKVWSILNQYTNSPLNELFTCFRVAKDNRVMPTMVFRQIPFTSEDFATQKFGVQDSAANSIHTTRFLTLPRWDLDSAFVLSADLGRDEAARINFVQFYARSNFSKNGFETSAETALRNYVFDNEDIKRSGLRPYIIQNQFDDVPDVVTKAAPVWARIMGDALIGGQLKMNGTVNTIGIVDPIAVGDNLEFDGVVYHIEQVNHIAAMNANGNKTFRSSLSLSHGVSVNSSPQGTLYAEMEYSNAYGSRQNDFNNDAILPGISEVQDTLNRPNIDYNPKKNPLDPQSGFPQPSTGNKPNTGE